MKTIITLLTLLFIVSLAYADDSNNKTTVVQGTSTQSRIVITPVITKLTHSSTTSSNSTNPYTSTGTTIQPYKTNSSTTGIVTPYTNTKAAPEQASTQQPTTPATKASPKQDNAKQPTSPVSKTAPTPAVTAAKIPPEQASTQQPTTPTTKATLEQTDIQLFTGKVVASVLADNEAKEVNSNILVIDEKGQMWVFAVKSNTPVTAKDGKILTPREIKMDDKVTVEYKTVKEAQSVKLAE